MIAGIVLGVIFGPLFWYVGVSTLLGGEGEVNLKTIGAAVALFLLGTLMGLPAFYVVIWWKPLTQPKHLVFDRTGVRWIVGGKQRFALRWEELSRAEVGVSAPVRISTPEHPIALRVDRTLVALDMYAAAPESFAARHQEMNRQSRTSEEPGLYRVPLAQRKDLVPQLAQGIHHYRSQIYGGVLHKTHTV